MPHKSFIWTLILILLNFYFSWYQQSKIKIQEKKNTTTTTRTNEIIHSYIAGFPPRALSPTSQHYPNDDDQPTTQKNVVGFLLLRPGSCGWLAAWILDWLNTPSDCSSVRLSFILCVVGAIVFALIYVNILLKRNKFSLPFGLSTRHLVSGVCDSLLSRFYYFYHLLLCFFQCELFYELNLTQSAYSFYYFKILKLIHFCLLLELLKLF